MALACHLTYLTNCPTSRLPARLRIVRSQAKGLAVGFYARTASTALTVPTGGAAEAFLPAVCCRRVPQISRLLTEVGLFAVTGIFQASDQKTRKTIVECIVRLVYCGRTVPGDKEAGTM